jgi:hypothetical protein
VLAPGRRPVLAPRGGRSSLGAVTWKGRQCVVGGEAVALMIVDGRGVAEMRYKKSRQDRHPRVRYQKSCQDRLWRSPMSLESSVCTSTRAVAVESVSRRCVHVLVFMMICCN